MDEIWTLREKKQLIMTCNIFENNSKEYHVPKELNAKISLHTYIWIFTVWIMKLMIKQRLPKIALSV